MKKEKGQSLVEFALVLPLLILIFTFIIEFGIIFHALLTIDHAGREAARAASVGKDDTIIFNTVVNAGASINLNEDNVQISPSGTRASGTNVTITITYPITFMTPVIRNLVGPLTLKDTTTMRVE